MEKKITYQEVVQAALEMLVESEENYEEGSEARQACTDMIAAIMNSCRIGNRFSVTDRKK